MAQKKSFSHQSVKRAGRKPGGPGKSPSKRGVHRKPEKIYSFEEADNRLYDIFRNHEFGNVPHETRHQFVRFYHLLMKQQKKENFTRLLRFRDVAIKHFIDCLMVDRLLELRFPLLDVGTGPGFPGIPLKLLYPEERIVLAEGVRKRVSFLKSVREDINLKNLDIVGRYIDEEFQLPMNMVITRAVAAVPKTLMDVSNCLQPGGLMVFMKGPSVDPEIKRAQKELAHLYTLEQDRAYTLPETPHERRLVVFRKKRGDEREPQS